MPKRKRNKVGVYNVSDIIKLEKRERIKMTFADRLAQKITGISGSIGFVYLHIVWFGIWILINTGSLGLNAFDPFPYSLLTTIVSLEAIFLSTFVLIAENKQSVLSDKRAKVDLQINAINEREGTKIIQMIVEIQKHLGMKIKQDPEILELEKKTNIGKLAKEIDSAEEKMIGK